MLRCSSSPRILSSKIRRNSNEKWVSAGVSHVLTIPPVFEIHGADVIAGVARDSSKSVSLEFSDDVTQSNSNTIDVTQSGSHTNEAYSQESTKM